MIGYERTRSVPAYIEVDGDPLCQREGHTCGLLIRANSRDAVNERGGFHLSCGYQSLTEARQALSIVREYRNDARVVRGFCPERPTKRCTGNQLYI